MVVNQQIVGVFPKNNRKQEMKICNQTVFLLKKKLLLDVNLT